MATRLSKGPGELSFPYQIYGLSETGARRTQEVTLDMSTKDSFTSDLYLAGIRGETRIRFFYFLSKLSIIAPICLVVLYILSGSLNMGNLTRALLVWLVLFGGVRLYAKLLKQKRQKRILRMLPQILDLIVVAVEAGLSFTSALEQILEEVDQKESLTQEFKAMYHEYLGGLPLVEACQRMDKRCQVPDLSLLLSCVVQSDQIGSGLGTNLRTQSSELRDKLRQRMRERAYRIPIKILFPMMLIFIGFIVINLGYIGFQLRSVVSGNIQGQSY